MKQFFRTVLLYVPLLIMGTLVLGAFAFGGLASAEPGKAWVGLGFVAALVGLLSYVTVQLRRPALRINDAELEIRGVFGGLRIVRDLAQCELVVNDEWIEIRQPQRQGITLSRNAFSATAWNEMLSSLRALPFKAVL